MTGAPHVAEVKQAAAGRETEILDKLGIAWRGGTPHIRCPYLGHLDKNPSWRWDREKSAAYCTCTDRPQSIFDVIMRVEGGDFSRSAVRAAEMIGRPDLIRSDKKTKPECHDDARPGCTVAEYAAAKNLPEDFLRSLGLSDTVYARSPAVKIPYRASAGTEIAIRYRIALGGADRFRWAKGTKAVLYGPDRLSEARDTGYVVLVEGESDCQTLWLHGFPALGLPGAATWNEDRDAPLLTDLKTVYIVIEPDKGGAAVMKWLKRSAIAPRVKLVRLKEVKDPNALHVCDPEGFSAAFQRALDEAEPYRPPSDGKGEKAQGRPLDLRSPEPWAEPVDGAELLASAGDEISRYMIMEPGAAEIAALWALHTHALDAFDITPRLSITSPQPRCGKTTLLDILDRLTSRPLAVSNVTAAALFRTVELALPTLLIDEGDTFLSDNEELRGVLNSGHRRGGGVVRVVGEAMEPRLFSTFAPAAIAMIGKLPGTLADRSIAITLKRKRPDEKAERFRYRKTAGLDRLARMSVRWAADNIEALREADPAIPESLFNRVAEPLFAIADRAGGKWPARARAIAAGALDAEDDSSVELLTDIRDLFEERGSDSISSADLVNALVAIEGRPWAEYGRPPKPMSANALARRLRRFNIRPQKIRFGTDTAQGYVPPDFEDAFARYCAPKLPSGAPQPEQSEQPAEIQGFPAKSQLEHGNGCSGYETAQNPSETANVPVVPVGPTKEGQSTAARRFKL